jgi:hypothetical protein
MEKGDLIHDAGWGMVGIILEILRTPRTARPKYVVLYEDGDIGTAYENELQRIGDLCNRSERVV